MPSSRLSQGYHGPVPFTLTALTSLYCLTSGSKLTGLSKPTEGAARMAEAAGSLAKRLLCCRERPNMLQATYFDDPLISTVILRVKMFNGVWSSNCYLHASKCTKPQQIDRKCQNMIKQHELLQGRKKGRQLEQNLKHHSHVCLLLL